MPARTTQRRSAGRSGAGLAVALLFPLYLLGAAWPLQLDPPVFATNGVRRIERGAVSFADPGVLRGSAKAVVRAARTARALDISLRVRTADRDQVGPARILELGTDHDRADLMVGQSGRSLVVRVSRPGSDPAGGPPLVARDAFDPDRAIDVVIRLRADRAEVSVDGRGVDARDAPDLFDTWSDDVALALGDSPVGARAWRGVVERAELRVPERLELDLLVEGALGAPAGIWIVPERLRLVVAHRLLPPSSWFDLSVNLLFFVPVGWLAARAAARRPLLVAVVVGAALSAAMECTQIAFAERVPSGIDLLTNVLGAAAGGRAFRAACGHDRRPRP